MTTLEAVVVIVLVLLVMAMPIALVWVQRAPARRSRRAEAKEKEGGETMNRRMIFVVVTIVVLALIGGGVYLGLHFTRPQGTATVRIGYLAITNSLPLYVAMTPMQNGEKSFLEEQGIKIETTSFQTSNQLAEALATGKIDIEVSASTSVLYAIEQRSPGQFKIFLVNAQVAARPPDVILVKKDSPISTIEELKGKKIGVFPGSTFAILTKIVFRNFMDPEKDITIVPMPPPLWLEALSKGEVDAVWAFEPFGTLALEQGVAKVIMESAAEKYVLDPLPAGSTAFSATFVKDNSKVAQRVKAAFDAAVDFIRSHEAEARKTIVKFTPTSETVAAKTYLPDFWKSEEIDKTVMQRYADILFEEGDLESKVDIRNMLY